MLRIATRKSVQIAGLVRLAAQFAANPGSAWAAQGRTISGEQQVVRVPSVSEV